MRFTLSVAQSVSIDDDPNGAALDGPSGALTARHVYVRSQFSHMPLVTSGRAIPVLLRLLPVETLPTSPWQAPLGQLPTLQLGSNGSASSAR